MRSFNGTCGASVKGERINATDDARSSECGNESIKTLGLSRRRKESPIETG